MAKEKTKKEKKATKSITKKTVKALIDKKFDEVNSRIDRILAAMAKSKSVRRL